MKITKNITTIALATGFAIAVPLANGATILNSTNFDGTEPTSDGNATGFEGGTTGFDTINGWTWATDWYAPGGGGTSTGDYTGTLFAGLTTVSAEPNRPFEDQQIRVGTSGTEILTNTEQFSFRWGAATNSDVALAQAFSLSSLLAVTVTYDVTSTNAGTYIYLDDGSGAWTTRAHTVVAGTGNTYTFTPTSSDIRIAFVGNDGADSDTLFDSIQVSQVPEPSSALLIGLGGLALTLRRRR